MPPGLTFGSLLLVHLGLFPACPYSPFFPSSSECLLAPSKHSASYTKAWQVLRGLTGQHAPTNPKACGLAVQQGTSTGHIARCSPAHFASKSWSKDKTLPPEPSSPTPLSKGSGHRQVGRNLLHPSLPLFLFSARFCPNILSGKGGWGAPDR